MSSNPYKSLSDYSIEAKIGQGGMAVVYKGVHKPSGKTVAIKFMHPKRTVDRSNVLRFQREAYTLLKLKHPHIIDAYDFGQIETDQVYYLVMEYIEGLTLKEVIDFLAEQRRVLNIERIYDLFRQIGEALAHAHRAGFIHRDIKPGNIMLRDGKEAILMDFGLAKMIQPHDTIEITSTGLLIGTPAYLSPEQIMGSPGDVRADVYALGVVLFQLVTGHLPFRGKATAQVLVEIVTKKPLNPRRFNPDISAALETVILKALAKDPNERFQSVQDMLQMLKLADGQIEDDTVLFQADSLTDSSFSTLDLVPTPFQPPPRPPYFANRQDELITLQRLLIENKKPVVGLAGIGGVGKSTLAIQLAHLLRPHFADGILWAQLDVSSVESELLSFATAFGQAEAFIRLNDLVSKATFVRNLLSEKEVLVVLDQLETMDTLKWLQPTGEQNQLLITTRNVQLLHRVNAEVIHLESFSNDETRRYLSKLLGGERVNENLETVNALTGHLGGLPLAVSIAAGTLANNTELSIEEYTELLADEHERLNLLTAWEETDRDVAASFELSYKQLPAQAQKIFQALAVFDGPDFDSLAVAAVTGLSVPMAKMILNRFFLLSLLKAGLGKRDGNFPIESDGNGRYRLHPLLKTFAKQKLGQVIEELQDRAAIYYANLAKTHADPSNYVVLDLDWFNILTAVQKCQTDKKSELIVKTVQAMTKNHYGTFGFFESRGHWRVAVEWLTITLQSELAQEDNVLRAELLLKMGAFLHRLHQDSAEANLAESLKILEQLPKDEHSTLLKAQACEWLAQAYSMEDYEEALDWVEKGLQAIDSYDSDQATQTQGYLLIRQATIIARRTRDVMLAQKIMKNGLVLVDQPAENPSAAQVSGLLVAGSLQYIEGNHTEALQLWFDGLEKAKELRDLRRINSFRQNIVIIKSEQGQFWDSIEEQKNLIETYHWMGDVRREALMLSNIGEDYTFVGEFEQAATTLQQALALADKHDILNVQVRSRINLAQLALWQNELENASEYLSVAQQLNLQMTAIEMATEIQRLQVQLLLAKGNHTEALNLALSAIRAQSESREIALFSRLTGQIYSHLKQFELAEKGLNHSLSLFEEQSAAFEATRTKLSLAAHFMRANQPSIGRTILEEAQTSFSDLGLNSTHIWEMREIAEIDIDPRG